MSVYLDFIISPTETGGLTPPNNVTADCDCDPIICIFVSTPHSGDAGGLREAVLSLSPQIQDRQWLVYTWPQTEVKSSSNISPNGLAKIASF